jgi:hypothetical protein
MCRLSLLVAALLAAGFALSGCLTTQPVWSFYDSCAAQNPGFVAMVECGREKRLAECVPNNNCSANGTAFMQYADGLALAVKNKEMTEAQAMQKFAEFKTQCLANIHHDQAIAAAGMAASAPKTCTAIGNAVNCF